MHHLTTITRVNSLPSQAVGIEDILVFLSDLLGLLTEFVVFLDLVRELLGKETM